jgi:hypothetical protein
MVLIIQFLRKIMSNNNPPEYVPPPQVQVITKSDEKKIKQK